MMFNSFGFLLFFAVVLLMYFFIVPEFRKYWLLLTSLFFYSVWKPAYLLLLLFCICVTFFCGIGIGKSRSKEKSGKVFLVAGILSNFLLLFFFKYANMFVDALNYGLSLFGAGGVKRLSVVLPVGISFYIFQAAGYVIDVYRGKTEAARNFAEYALFVTFFPQLVAGPIERSENMLSQIRNIEKLKLWDFDRISSGFLTMLWGYFMKTVIADRAALIADNVFGNFRIYGSTELLLGVLCFSVQIYCDFGGYSAIAIGAAKIMGIDLMENFNAPYLAGSIREFWGRWHISLSTWFKDYLYIPLGGSRKGKIRKNLNLFVVFLVSGLWHGADWSFVVWGGLHGLYRVAEELLRPKLDSFLSRRKVNTACFSWKLLSALTVFALTAFAWIFFRADSIASAAVYIQRLFTCYDPWILFDGGLGTLGIPVTEFNILIAAVLILIVVDGLRVSKGKKPDELIRSQNEWFRWTVALLLICACVFFNCSGDGISKNQFIYFQF